MVPPCSDRISRVPPYSRIPGDCTRTGLSPTTARLSRRFRLISNDHWPGPRSLATTSGVSVDVLSSGYLDVSVRRVRFADLWIQSAMTHKGRVSPFGNPRINGRSPLPAAYRSVLRPSSPLSAKASTKCPLTLDPTTNQHAGAKIPHAGNAIGHSALRHTRPQDKSERTPTIPPIGGDPEARRRKDRPRPHNLSTMSNNPTPHAPAHRTRSRAAFPCFFPTRNPKPIRSNTKVVELNGIEPCRPKVGQPTLHRARPHRLVAPLQPDVVELNGIEPMTSCLQSRRSPN